MNTKKFAVGDRVTIFSPNMTMIDGQVGTVVEDRGLWIDIQLDDGSLVGMFERELKHHVH